MTKKAIVMRGLPGSGKSTRAREIAESIGKIHSTDDFFMEDGVYRFDPAKLAENHYRNYVAFVESLNAGEPVVICDNTNTEKWEYRSYAEAARRFGYEVEIVKMPHLAPEVLAARTTHGVPVQVIRNMLARWED